ncbi:MAG: hypothetical protein U1F25_01795 [Rubrivivax sp.]
MVMLALSAFIRHWGWAVGLLLGAGLAACAGARRNEDFRRSTDAAFLRLPLFGRLARSYNAARFGGTLACWRAPACRS